MKRNLVIALIALAIGLSGAMLLRVAGGERIEAIVTLHVVEAVRYVGISCGYGPEALLSAETAFLAVSAVALSIMPFFLLRWTVKRAA